ncbi:MAG: cytochrome c [Pirellulales bacterium]|nr:cytochrome c [Pirellulales bacterium]
MKYWGALMVVGLVCSASAADCTIVRRSVGRHVAVQVDAGLAVVPFAVPVAVPVAVISQPVVFYARRVELAAEVSPATARERRATPRAPRSAADVLRTHCAACHSGPTAKGELRLFEPEGALVERLPRRAILDAVTEGSMPQGTSTLTEEEIDALREWATPPRELLY